MITDLKSSVRSRVEWAGVKSGPLPFLTKVKKQMYVKKEGLCFLKRLILPLFPIQYFFSYTQINIIYNGYTLIHRTEYTVLFMRHTLRHMRQFYVLHI